MTPKLEDRKKSQQHPKDSAWTASFPLNSPANYQMAAR